jgi:hypothetical protein
VLAAGLVAGAVGFLRHAPLSLIALLAVTVFAGCSIIVFLWLHFSPVVKGVLRRKGVLDSPDVRLEAERPPEESARERLGALIEGWRSVIPDYDLDRQDERQRFLKTDTYYQMKKYGLKPEVIEMFEADRTFHVGKEVHGGTAYKSTLLDEVARIEEEQVLNAPEPATNRTTPGELRALCLHLADELDNLHKRHENDEQKIMAWAAGLSGSGTSDDDFDQQVANTQDENHMRTLNKYNSDLKGRLLNLYATLESQGWLGDGDRSRIESLNDPYQLRELALRLRDVGNKLP